MERVVYNSDHKAFIRSLFSPSFMKEAEVTTKKLLGHLFRKVLVNERTDSYVYPTPLLQSLNHALGDRRYELDSEIRTGFLQKLNLTSTEILHVIVTDFITMEDPQLETYIPLFADADSQTQGVLLEEFFTDQFDALPAYVEEKLLAMLYMFACELDISDGRSAIDCFDEVFDLYTDLGAYNTTRFSASLLSK